jgi:hypothetical protein
MKKGKVILGVATAVISIGSVLAFKVAHFGQKFVYGKTSAGVCKPCASLWTNHSASHHSTVCNTVAGGGGAVLHGQGVNQRTWYTKTVSGVCTNPVTKVTISE